MMAAERKSFEEQLAAKNAQVATLRDEQLQLRKEREQLKDERAAIELTVQKKADELVQQREIVVRTQEQERSSLKEAELQKTIADMRAQLVEAQRKADQGSQQMQGEVLELAIEEGLRRAFPLDTIEEVKKGQRGGDVLQHVVTRTGQTAGTILWETKRAKDWSLQWIPKLKEDMRGCGATLGILVTMPSAVPEGMASRPGIRSCIDGVWIVVWPVALQLAEALRAGALDVPQTAPGLRRQGREDGSAVRLSDLSAVRAEAQSGVRNLHQDAPGTRIRKRPRRCNAGHGGRNNSKPPPRS